MGLSFEKSPKSTAFSGKISFCIKKTGHLKSFFAKATTGVSVSGGASKIIISYFECERYFFKAFFKNRGSVMNATAFFTIPILWSLNVGTLRIETPFCFKKCGESDKIKEVSDKSTSIVCPFRERTSSKSE